MDSANEYDSDEEQPTAYVSAFAALCNDGAQDRMLVGRDLLDRRLSELDRRLAESAAETAEN